MKSLKAFSLLVILLIIATINIAFQQGEPWTKEQLMEPSDLAAVINDTNSAQPVIFSIGPQAVIKNSIDIGPTMEKNNLKKLRSELAKLSKDVNVVLYCGCCPFDKCPNIRPAFNLLIEMKFTNPKLLNLSHNIKKDWIDYGYPTNE